MSDEYYYQQHRAQLATERMQAEYSLMAAELEAARADNAALLRVLNVWAESHTEAGMIDGCRACTDLAATLQHDHPGAALRSACAAVLDSAARPLGYTDAVVLVSASALRALREAVGDA